MAEPIYYKEESWETYPASKRYNFYIVAVNQAGDEVEHELNDWCYAPVTWPKAAKTLRIRRAAFARLKIPKYERSAM